jgi:uncharacterized membrane protein YhaH (DUF805 family)
MIGAIMSYIPAPVQGAIQGNCQMHNQHEHNPTMSTWQRLIGWVLIAVGVFGLLLLLLNILSGFAQFHDIVKDGLHALGFLTLGTAHLLSARRRRVGVVLTLLAVLLLMLSFMVPYAPQ